MWYDLSPQDYAKSLIFSAERSEKNADFKMREAKPWSRAEAVRCQRQALRLRTMARICEKSDAPRAGLIDFRRLDDPTLTGEQEDAVVAAVIELYGAPRHD